MQASLFKRSCALGFKKAFLYMYAGAGVSLFGTRVHAWGLVLGCFLVVSSYAWFAVSLPSGAQMESSWFLLPEVL